MKYITPILETERLILKRGIHEDYLKVYEYNFTKLENICGEFEYVKNDPKSLEGWENDADERDEVFDWIIYLKPSMQAIGNIVADHEEKSIKATELTTHIHPTYWRQGYMTEAVTEVMNYLFSFGFDNIIWSYSEGNFKSKNLCTKLGFILYKIQEKSWYKNGQPITSYRNIMSRERFYNMQSLNKSKSK